MFMGRTKNMVRIVVLLLIGVAIVYLTSTKSEQASVGSRDAVSVVPRCEGGNCPGQKEPVPQENQELAPVISDKSKRFGLAKEMTTLDGFINTEGKPITLQESIGKKVILVDFWTYTCINCQRTLPYLNSWYEKYRDDGLLIVGVHTPEFEFEQKYENVLDAVRKFDIKYPVVLDNDYSTWGAYGNRYWPRKYLIDIDGYIVYDHIGEGAYEETEMKIQDALRERKRVLGESGTIDETLTKEEVGKASEAKSPEIYFGAFRNERLGNGEKGRVGPQTFVVPEAALPDVLYLSGSWNIESQFAHSSSDDARIVFTYRARDVFFVGSSADGAEVEVLIDGVPVSSSMKGADVGVSGSVTVKDERLYTLIRGTSVGDHTLELRVKKGTLKAFTFTFG